MRWVARGLCFKWRPSIGKVNYPQPVPNGVDYSLWLGPAPEKALLRKRLHYDWHWQWEYGNGDMGNQGVHEMDLARWALGVGCPGIQATGGHFMFDDDHWWLVCAGVSPHPTPIWPSPFHEPPGCPCPHCHIPTASASRSAIFCEEGLSPERAQAIGYSRHRWGQAGECSTFPIDGRHLKQSSLWPPTATNNSPQPAPDLATMNLHSPPSSFGHASRKCALCSSAIKLSRSRNLLIPSTILVTQSPSVKAKVTRS